MCVYLYDMVIFHGNSVVSDFNNILQAHTYGVEKSYPAHRMNSIHNKCHLSANIWLIDDCRTYEVGSEFNNILQAGTYGDK